MYLNTLDVVTSGKKSKFIEALWAFMYALRCVISASGRGGACRAVDLPCKLDSVMLKNT
jgi:hypothetical protein